MCEAEICQGITQIAEGATGLLAALGMLPVALAAPLVAIAAGIGSVVGARRQRKKQQESVEASQIEEAE